MTYSTEKGDNLWWLMTGGDVNSVRTVLTFLGSPAWREDLPKVMRGALGRQRSGRWDTTVANAWGRLALKKFGKAFESAAVTGTTTGELSREKKSLDWATHKAGGTMFSDGPKGQTGLPSPIAGQGLRGPPRRVSRQWHGRRPFRAAIPSKRV